MRFRKALPVQNRRVSHFSLLPVCIDDNGNVVSQLYTPRWCFLVKKNNFFSQSGVIPFTVNMIPESEDQMKSIRMDKQDFNTLPRIKFTAKFLQKIFQRSVPGYHQISPGLSDITSDKIPDDIPSTPVHRIPSLVRKARFKEWTQCLSGLIFFHQYPTACPSARDSDAPKYTPFSSWYKMPWYRP